MFGSISTLISGPSFGSGAWSFAPRGLRPVGSWPDPEGGLSTGVPGGGAALAAGPEQGSAAAGGARPPATTSPIAVAEAIDTDTTRENAGMSPLSASAAPQQTPQLADVTIVTFGACAFSELSTGMCS